MLSDSNSNMKIMKSLLVIFLLVFLFPVGIIAMWFLAPWSKGFKWFITLLIPGLILLLLIVLIMINMAGVNSRRQAVLEKMNQPLSQSIAYIDQNYPISFNYPSNWYLYTTTFGGEFTQEERLLFIYGIAIRDNDESTNQIPNCQFKIDIFNNSNSLDLEKWYEQVYTIDSSSLENTEKAIAELAQKTTATQINGIPAITNLQQRFYYMSHSGKIYRINHSLNENECKTAYDTILNNFKFIN